MAQKIFKSGLTRSLVSGLCGFVAYGGWAYFANQSYGEAVAGKAAVTQGSYSFVVTLVMTLWMEYLFRWLSNSSLRVQATVLTTCLLLFTTSWGVNALTGTPEILMTILPGFVVGSVYTLVYVLSLAKLEHIRVGTVRAAPRNNT